MNFEKETPVSNGALTGERRDFADEGRKQISPDGNETDMSNNASEDGRSKPSFMTVSEVLALCNWTAGTFYTNRSRGFFPIAGEKKGKYLVFNRDQVLAWDAKRREALADLPNGQEL